MYYYEDCRRLKISDLKKLGCLTYGQHGTMPLIWKSNGEVTAKINIHLYITSEDPKIILEYTCNGDPRKYQIDLITMPSNLGRGVIWYFRCHYTGKLCRQLYLADGYFLHRSGLKNTIYSIQNYSKKSRQLYKYFGGLDSVDNAEKKIYAKYSKPYYNGQQTKWYKKSMKYLKQLKNSENMLSRLIR